MTAFVLPPLSSFREGFLSTTHIVHVPLFILMKIRHWEQLWVFQINGEWKALVSMWGGKKTPNTPDFITTALLVQLSQTAGFPAGELWLVLYQHFRDLISLKDLFAHSGLAVHLAVITRLLNTIRLDKCNNIFPSCSVSWYFKNTKALSSTWTSKSTTDQQKRKAWLLT